MSVYVFDLDGTICHTQGNNYADAQPIAGRIAVVNALYDQGHEIVIESARGSVTGQDWQRVTEDQLHVWGLKCHRVRTGKKVYGDYYIDDKGVPAEEFFS